MHLSRLRIKNYRSINEIELKFQKGKNVILGKNNSGKSNIVKAINILLGESSPSYHKSENITENDFFKGNVEHPIYIFCELQRDDNEELNYDEIYKCLGFKFHADEKKWDKGLSKWVGPSARHALRTDILDHFWDDLDTIITH